MKNQGGRPTDYTPELLEKAKEYEAMEHETIPSIAGLSLHLDISRETCHVWAKDETKQEFSDIYRRIMAKQENTLVNKGLNGTFNPTITKLILTKHGYTDKQDITTDGKALPTPILNGVSVHNGNEENNPTP